MKYLIDPVAKPRQTRRDRWAKRPTVVRYRAFADLCRLMHMKVMPGNEITFHVPMPSSWSLKKKKEMNGKPHTQRPDLDNYLKAVFDAVHKEDSHIWWVTAKKIWSDVGYIEIKENEYE